MMKNFVRTIFIFNIIISLSYSVFRLLHGNKWEFLTLMFVIWVSSPYFLISLFFKWHSFKKYVISTLLLSLICTSCTFYAYHDISSTSTAALVFLVAPLYLNIGLPVIYLMFLYMENRKSGKDPDHTEQGI